MKIIKSILLVLTILILANCSTKKNSYRITKNYEPDDTKLYKAIVQMDSAFFDAYNNCHKDINKYSAFYADNIEFYHDKSGFMNSKQEIVEGTQKYVCGKVTRSLVKGSIEVYPINNYGAIEIGLHQFHNKEEPNTISKIGRFTIVWKKEKEEWKILKVISLH